MKTALPEPPHRQLPRISATLLKFFLAYSRSCVRKNFHAMRVLSAAMPPGGCAGPCVFYANHASWWDPLVFLLLSREFFPGRAAYGPIDAAMLERYGIFRRLGFFGVEKSAARGAREFLRMSRAILASSNNALWLTPEGRFTDVRERPLQMREGIGALAAREPDAWFVPVAVEYTFWKEPKPEILVAFGEPVSPRNEMDRPSGEWTRFFADRLSGTQDALAQGSRARNPADWLVVSRGRGGVTWIYDTWRRLWARLRGGKFHREHSPEAAR